MKNQTFKIGQTDTIKYYATSPTGKLLTRHKEEDGFRNFNSIIYTAIRDLPNWYDESSVTIHIICEEKGLSKTIGKRIGLRKGALI
jgi:hypothetical protein